MTDKQGGGANVTGGGSWKICGALKDVNEDHLVSSGWTEYCAICGLAVWSALI